MENSTLYSQIELLPDHLKLEVKHFVEFLLNKKTESKKSIVKNMERTPGLAKGLIEIAPDFDEPIDDFKEYMG